MTTDTDATPSTPKTKAPRQTKAQLEAEERRQAKARNETNERARLELRKLLRTVTQGDWLKICRALDLTREQIADDENLTLLAAAWVKDTRANGASDWDVLLELTDRQLLEFHGYALAPLPPEEDPGVLNG